MAALLTLDKFETVMIRRCSALMQAAGMRVEAIGGNTDLADPIAFSIRQLGGLVGDPTAPANTDLEGFGADDLDNLFDLAELRLLKNIFGNFAAVDMRLGPMAQSFNNLRTGLLARIEALEKTLQGRGVFLQAEAGSIDLNFAQHFDEDDEHTFRIF